MSKIQVNHIKTAIENIFDKKIDMSDWEGRNKEEIDKAFRSRALAAYSLHILASANIDIASSSITDGYNDNGIDAVLYDDNRVNYILYSRSL